MFSVFIILDILVVLLLIALCILGIYLFFNRKKEKKQPSIKFAYINEKSRDFLYELKKHIDHKEGKPHSKAKIKKQEMVKVAKKSKRTYIIEFHGSVFAEEVKKMRDEISAVLMVANPKQDEVIIKMDSPGGSVNGYGLAASQLQRIKDRGVKLTALVDQMAASGGYMMACVADEIIAAPFAYIGSVGVVTEFPNFSKVLDKLGVEWKTYTAGKSKRDVNTFGKITPEAEKRHQKKLVAIHELFKSHIKENRPKVDIDKIATGEVWTAKEAVKLNLVDKIQTSDEYILNQMIDANVYKVYTPEDRSRFDRILDSVGSVAIRKAKELYSEIYANSIM